MLRPLEASEINEVLKANYSIWSPGLDLAKYRHYQWWQLHSAWGRKNLRYYGYFSNSGELLASCKRYRFVFQSRGLSYLLAGVGAVFVPESNRGHSYGLQMLNSLAELCSEENYDAMLLNSDIDPDYYERLGYEPFDASSFTVDLSDEWLTKSICHLDSLKNGGCDESYVVRAIQESDLAEMCKHHRRWLASVEYGMIRSEDYWNFKLGRERYLFEHSRLNWPKMEIITANYGQFRAGYALIEQSGPYMRVLEVLADADITRSLWSQILRLAQRRRASRLRGWLQFAPSIKGLSYHQRDWALPMINPLNEGSADKLLSWTEIFPCRLMELDHF